MLFRPFTLLLLLSCFILGMTLSEPAYAKKTFFENMFGWMKPQHKGLDPADTLKAPFSDDTTDTVTAAAGEVPVPLKHAHTNEAEIGKWLVTAVSDAMSFKVGENTNVADANGRYFASSGKTQFQDFLKQNNIQKVIESGKYNISSFVREEPLLLNSGTANNRFRWLYEVPIMVSYMDAKDFNYKEDTPVNQDIILTIQVGRFSKVGDDKNNFNVLIETWTGKSRKIDKN